MATDFSPPANPIASEAILQVHSLSFSHDPGTGLLQDVSLSIKAGEMVALYGLNGSGKSTLLRCLTGFHKAQCGEIIWQNQNLKTLSPAQVAQTAALVDSEEWEVVPFSIGELVLMGRNPRRQDWEGFSRRDQDLTDQLMAKLSLQSIAGRMFSELSRGERQRTKLAMALVREPGFLLLDEPTSHLDPFFQKETLTLLRGLAKEKNLGMLAVLHDINLSRFFDRVLVLHQGTISLNGSPRELLSQDRMDQIYGKGVFHFQNQGDLPIAYLTPD